MTGLRDQCNLGCRTRCLELYYRAHSDFAEWIESGMGPLDSHELEDIIDWVRILLMPVFLQP